MAGMRKSAEVRREEILAVAIEQFAEGGYHGTSTEVIAKDAGISQPYLFRLFRTKRELFLACDDRACEKVIDAFRAGRRGAHRRARSCTRWARRTSASCCPTATRSSC